MLNHIINCFIGLSIGDAIGVPFEFEANPELIDEINEQGGSTFLQNCSHIVNVPNSRWEGIGLDSNFIKVLCKSYETFSKSINKFKQ